MAERAVVIAEEMDSLAGEAIALLVWGQALASLEALRWDEAESHSRRVLRLKEFMPSPPQAGAHTWSGAPSVATERTLPLHVSIGSRPRAVEAADHMARGCGTWTIQRFRRVANRS